MTTETRKILIALAAGLVVAFVAAAIGILSASRAAFRRGCREAASRAMTFTQPKAPTP
ncbi:hypothetical protein [Bosea spartocytisi]|uniref:hypothetical protein n=1 Tax=Bosea spartocytisi TaxID=2773451 RepID=UPI0021AACC81|nr:hypothetical protein [Bosea spartocytisi]MCT4475477.1 hypothetical protein [Bosea spartocytisi]